MTEQGQGVVQSVENRTGKSGKVFYAVNIGGVKLTTFEVDIHKAVNQTVNYNYTTNGNWKNLQSWDVLPASQQPPPQQGSPYPVPTGLVPRVNSAQQAYSQVPQGQNNDLTVTTAGAVPQLDARQESIVRQSTMKMAIEVAGDMAVSGISFIPEGEKKTAKAKKDPELYLEYVKQLAIRFKDFIQKGSWDNVWAEVDSNDKNYAETHQDEDIPF